MKASVVIPTRGDVDLGPILRSLHGCEVVVWDNGAGRVTKYNNGSSPLRWYAKVEADGVPDLAVYARYAAIEYASNDLILTQDDDCIVSDPRAIVDAWLAARSYDFAHPDHKVADPLEEQEHLVANMPPEFRPHYPDSCLVGFGACFRRDLPERAFVALHSAVSEGIIPGFDTDWFERTCDVVFTTLTQRVLVDVPKTNMPWAQDENRMYRQPGHVGERARMLELARRVRDGSEG